LKRIQPLKREEHPELEEYYKVWDERLGYLPNTVLTLSMKPEIVKAFARLSEAVHNECSLQPLVRGLVGFMASNTASCNYCMAHTAAAAVRYGVPEKFVVNIADYDENDIYSAELRAALAFAEAMSSQPARMTDAILEEAGRHYTDVQIVEIAAICSFYGWLNRMNSGLRMELEEEPRKFSEENLSKTNWTIGTHAAASEY
jgi:uncharacterized peroxidase-related enzyme